MRISGAWLLDPGEYQHHRLVDHCVGIALLCILPWFAWELVFPRPIDLTAYADTVDYEFRDEEYAQEFAELN